MGIPHINGYINQDDKLWFIASVSTTKDFEEQLTRSGELGKLIKDPEKSVSEIEKKKKIEHEFKSAFFQEHTK